MVEGGEFWVQKRCGSKPLSTASKSLAHSMSNPIAARGFSLVIKPCPDPEAKLVNEQGPIVETSDHSINRRHGGSGYGDRTVSSRYHDEQFFM